MVKIKALKSFPYNGHRVDAGDVLVVSEKNAKILKALRKADYHTEAQLASRSRKRKGEADMPAQSADANSAQDNVVTSETAAEVPPVTSETAAEVPPVTSETAAEVSAEAAQDDVPQRPRGIGSGRSYARRDMKAEE